MTQTTDPGDIREAYERSEAYTDDAMDALVGEEWDDLPVHLQDAIKLWYSHTTYCHEAVEDRLIEARKGPQPGDGNYVGEDGEHA